MNLWVEVLNSFDLALGRFIRSARTAFISAGLEQDAVTMLVFPDKGNLEVAEPVHPNNGSSMNIDAVEKHYIDVNIIRCILGFTANLLNNCFNKDVYNSTEVIYIFLSFRGI